MVDSTYREGLFPGVPAESLVICKAFPGRAGWKYWYAWQIRSVVIKNKPDLVITTGDRIASRVRPPQWQWQWEEVGPGTSLMDYMPLPGAEKDRLKQQYAGGREYFLSLVTGNAGEQRIDLLKAFSLFKKRQKSNMQLVFAGKRLQKDDAFEKKLDTYKYREDVHSFDDLSGAEWEGLLGASYAFVFPFTGNSLGIPVLNAWKTGTPVITALTGRVPEMAGEAALRAKPEDPASMAAQMMLLYKDESLRLSLIEKGRVRAGSFLWEHTADQLWARILQTIGDANK